MNNQVYVLFSITIRMNNIINFFTYGLIFVRQFTIRKIPNNFVYFDMIIEQYASL